MRSWLRAGVILLISLSLSLGLYGLINTEQLNLGASPLLPLMVGVAFAINLIAWVPAAALKSERFYDLVGSLTFLSLVALLLLGDPAPSGRVLLAASLVGCWALRLGLFLARRVVKDGGDPRFDELKSSPSTFLISWSLQALWVTLTLSPLFALRAAEAGAAGQGSGLHWLEILGLSLWLFGFLFEVTADQQKRRARAASTGSLPFMAEGLWAWCQHPNYFGEITLWAGLALFVSPSLTGGALFVAWVSPLFVTLLLTKVSGIPLLQARAKARWGEDPAFQAYQANTPHLIPRRPRRA